MRSTMTILTLVLFQLFFSVASANGVFKWKDKFGKTQYGDKPPKGVRAKPVKMPAITVIKNYGQQWSSPQTYQPQNEEQKQDSSGAAYSTVAIVAPKGNQAMRANDGDVTVMLDIKPKLKKGHSIIIFLDGKQVSNSTSRAVNVPNLERGLHTVRAEIRNAYNKTLKSSDTISFTVLRTSILHKKKQVNPGHNLYYENTGANSPWPTKK